MAVEVAGKEVLVESDKETLKARKRRVKGKDVYDFVITDAMKRRKVKVPLEMLAEVKPREKKGEKPMKPKDAVLHWYCPECGREYFFNQPPKGDFVIICSTREDGCKAEFSVKFGGNPFN